MKAKLHGGQQVPVFLSFFEAKDAGFLSRSDWRRQSRRVDKDEVAAGIVVKKKVLLDEPTIRVVVPILEVTQNGLLIAERWEDVFGQDQTVEQNKPKFSKKADNSASLQEQEEGGGEGSLMTPKASQMAISQGFSANANKQNKSTVNSVRAYVPEGLVLPDNCFVKEQIWWLLGLLYWKHLERRETWDKPINLMYDHLKANIPNWPEVWKWCDKLELVERTPGYTPGERSYGYWTAMPYQEQIHRLHSFEHAGLSKRLRAIQRRHFSRPIMVHLRQQLERLTVDMDEFNCRFQSNPNRHYYKAHLQTILDGELRLTQDDFSGRLHSNVSNMFKLLRALLRVDGETDTLGETDIKNSQPLFLGLAAKQQGVEDKKYMELCEQGLIYDHLAGRLGVFRESAKHEMMMFFFAKNGFRSTAKSVFEIEFPKMAAYIRKVKEKDHKRLARRMQTAERKFVIDTICERLKRRSPEIFMATIHDAVLAKKCDCDLIVSVMREEFILRGVNPRLEWHDVAGHTFVKCQT